MTTGLGFQSCQLVCKVWKTNFYGPSKAKRPIMPVEAVVYTVPLLDGTAIVTSCHLIQVI